MSLTDVAIIIPWHNSRDPDRSRALIYVRDYLTKLNIGRVYMGESNEKPLNRAKMRNYGAKKAIGDGAKVLLFNDADCLFPESQLRQTIDLIKKADGVVTPYNAHSFPVNETQTAEILGGSDFNYFIRKRGRTITPAAGNFGCSTDTYLKLKGLDEAYRGWGHEDTDFVTASSRFISKTRAVPGSFVELFHPPTYKRGSIEGPASIQGTPESAHLLRNATRYQIKQTVDLDRWLALQNKELLNIVVPVMRHGMAEKFMPNTDFPVIAVVHNDRDLAYEWRHAGAGVLNCKDSTFAQKCNYAYKSTDTEWLLFIGEDVIFPHNWHSRLYKYLSTWGVVGTNDRLYSNTSRSTHLIMNRHYVEEFGGSWDKKLPFHEYQHNYCDTEAVSRASQINQWKYAPDLIIKHIHHGNGGVEQDEVYKLGNSTMEQDKQEYAQRYRKYNRYA